jgi:hypothetical protein
MAKDLNFQINVDDTDAVSSIEKLTDNVSELNSEIKDTAKTSEKVGTNLKKSTESGAKGFRAMGGAIKAAGIGLLIGAITLVKDVFASNQKVMDVFSAVLGTLTDMIRDFFSFVSENAGQVVEWFSQIFNDPVKAIQDFGQAIVDNLTERFNSFLETLGYVGKAISELFKGDFDAAWNSAMKAAEESVDILTGVDNTVEKVTEAVTEAAEAFINYATSTYDANASLVALQNNAKLAAAQQARLAEQYDRQAELLRQLRDDERNSITDRIKANNDLLGVLDKQEAAELAAANAQVEAAAATYNHSKTIDNQTALIQAQTAADGVRAKVAGLRSEQQMNDLALNRELNDLLRTQNESIADLTVSEQKFQAEREKNEIEKLKLLRASLEEEKIIQLARLQNEVDKHKEGTQARVDAEIAYNQKKLELDQALVLNEDALREANLIRAKEQATLLTNITEFGKNRELALLEIEYAEKARLYKGDQEMAVLLEQEKQEKIRLINQAARDKQFEMASNAIGALMELNNSFNAKTEAAAKRQFAINKAFSLSQAIINTYQAVNAALTAGGNPAKLATGAQFVEAGIALTAGLANVVKISQTKFGGGASASGGSTGGGGAPGGGGGGTEAPAPANFAFLGNQPNQQPPLQAYVVSTQVSSNLEAQQLINNQARLGG